MATQKFGPFGPFSGKLGKVIGYVDKKGKQRLRTIGEHIFSEPSDKLLCSWEKTSMTAAFLKPVVEFVRIGLALEADIQDMSAYNLGSSLTRKAIIGQYPDLQIDFSKVLFSSGKMPVVKNPEVIAADNGLMFTWDNNELQDGTLQTDRAMLMAYLPDNKMAFFTRSGAKRKQGYDYLEIPLVPAGQRVETYISFNAEDQKSISNSVYTGQIIFANIK